MGTPSNIVDDGLLLNFCISLNCSQMCACFCKDLVTGYLPVPGKKLDSRPSFVFKLILSPTPCCYGLDVASDLFIVSKSRCLSNKQTGQCDYGTLLHVKIHRILLWRNSVC